MSYGKLLLTLPDGAEQEYDLGKASLTLGRATTNDIILDDSRASRLHARLQCGPQGCELLDQGSSNGTRLNGLPVRTAWLKPGDLIQIGGIQLRYESSPLADQPPMTMIDSEADLQATLMAMKLPVELNETRTPRLVVVGPDQTWEVPLAEVDQLTIGRAAENGLVLESSKISRLHATLTRQGQSFVLRDPGSTNGVWLRGQRIAEHRLQDGESVRIGPYQVVFKSGFSEESLTLLDMPSPTRTKTPVVFVPGLMGSELYQGSERVWPNVKVLFQNPEVYRYSPDSALQPRGIVGDVIIVPNLVKLEQYSRLGDYLVEELGYQRGLDFFEFFYDWRQDVRQSARQLAQAVEAWGIQPPFTLMGHSLGTLVSRYYVERLGGKRSVGRLILMGGPHLGTPTAVANLVRRAELLPFGLLGDRLRQVLITFPSLYQILPTYLCVCDQSGAQLNLLDDETWVAPAQRAMLGDARQFRQELGAGTSVPTISIFGYGMKTISGINIQRNERGEWSNLALTSELSGDSTIPERSAMLEGTEIHPVRQNHGSLYVDNDVKMRLKLELTRPY